MGSFWLQRPSKKERRSSKTHSDVKRSVRGKEISMRIRIQKINSGVMFTAMTANGKPTKRITKPIKELTWNAFEWYHQQVLNAFAERGIADIGDFKRSCPTRDEKTGILTLELNPWGFVLRHALCDGRGCEGCDS